MKEKPDTKSQSNSSDREEKIIPQVYREQSNNPECKEYIFEPRSVSQEYALSAPTGRVERERLIPKSDTARFDKSAYKARFNRLSARALEKILRKKAFIRIVLPAIAVALVVVVGIGVAGINMMSAAPANVTSNTYDLKRVTYDAYNVAFDFIEYEFPLEIVVGNGKGVEMLTGEATVQQLLDMSGIELGEHDEVSVPLDTVVTGAETIEITRVNYNTVTRETILPYESKTIESQNIPKGKTELITKGKNGKVQEVYSQKIENGQVVSEELISTKTVSTPVEEVYKKGVGGVFTAPDGKKYNYSFYLDVSATAYGDVSEGKNPNWHGITAIGVPCRPGIIGVDPKTIPYRSNVYVIGNYGDFGVCYAADTGNISGAVIDIYMERYADMVAFGRRKMRAYILE